MNLMTTQSGTTDEVQQASTEILFYGSGECALGKVLIARSDKGVCAILLGDNERELEVDLAARFPNATVVANQIAIRNDLAEVIRFVDQPSDGLHLTLDMRGTPLQRRMWEAIRGIPVGKTMSYTRVARLINCVYPKAAARAVANACAANPIALAIPCHRVVRSDGDLADYRWGVQRKRELIATEAKT